MKNGSKLSRILGGKSQRSDEKVFSFVQDCLHINSTSRGHAAHLLNKNLLNTTGQSSAPMLIDQPMEAMRELQKG
jgi:hypothetical protein